jgi:sterol desaturase/sphingolipid hydroxylase (fatty acid hydroxylase superfamily)
MTPTAWILRVSESKTNYWATYVVDGALMLFFIVWDVMHLDLSAGMATALFFAGIATWSLTEYVFHRWVYHLGFAIARNGHEKHHHDPKAYIAMPWFVTPLVFLPPQQLIANYYGYRGPSAFLAGFFLGFIAYSFMHHSLHHYRLKFAWYRHLQSEHRIHHAFPESNFGVTMRFWDRVFGTVFTKESR